MFDAQKLNLEHAVLAVDALNRNFRKKGQEGVETRKNFFQDETTGRSAAAVVFEDLRKHCLQRLKFAVARGKPSGGPPFYLLAGIMTLVANSHLISSAKQLGSLKNKYGIDWEQGVAEVRLFVVTQRRLTPSHCYHDRSGNSAIRGWTLICSVTS